VQLKHRFVAIVGVVLLIAGPATTKALANTVVGMKIGLAQSQLNVDGWGGSEWHSGITVGPYVSIGVNSHLSVEPNLLFTQLGGTFRDQSSLPGGWLQVVEEVAYSVDYLEVPLLFRFRPSPGGSMPIVLIAGPVWRTVLSSEWSFDGDSREDWAESPAFAIALGVGVEAQLGKLEGRLEILYNRSLTTVGSSDSFTDDGSLSGFNFQMGLGF